MTKKEIIIACYGHLTYPSIAKVANCSRPYVTMILTMLELPNLDKNSKYGKNEFNFKTYNRTGRNTNFSRANKHSEGYTNGKK